MDNYIGVKCCNQEDYTKLQTYLLNKHFNWINMDTGIRSYNVFIILLIDIKKKEIATHQIPEKLPYIVKDDYIIEKVFSYKEYMNQIRIEKLNKINKDYDK